MRPILLEMNGFASFREDTRVDFADVEYFTLVGPTGAGKSTVIDAMTFALYGTVARWDHESMVSPALAPTVSRGTVRLIFDIAGARYSVAREVRRISSKKKSIVTVKSARLERFHNPEALGGPDEDTDVLAADSGVTGEVERLLGLTFKHFCTCVALPQGDFAEFLHATAGDRQKILSRLLGLGVYDQIARLAGEVATRQHLRADTLTSQLDSYVDATAEAAEALTARVASLRLVDARVRTALPVLDKATESRAEAAQKVTAVEHERAVLAAVVRPAGVVELDSEQRAAAEAHATATSGLSTAQEQDTEARAALRTAPHRHDLEAIQSDWDELGKAAKALPDLRTKAQADKDARKVAEAESTAALEAVKLAQAASVAADGALADLRENADRRGIECGLLDDLHAPTDLAEHAAARSQAKQRVADTEASLTKAKIVAEKAREALAAQPDGVALSDAVTSATELRDTCTAQLAVVPEHAQRRDQLASVHAHLDRLDREIDAAQATVDEAERADKAAALRANLIAGQPCPVCEQEVHVLPHHQRDPRISEARALLAKLAEDRASVESERRTLQDAVSRDTGARTEALVLLERRRQALSESAVVSHSLVYDTDLVELGSVAADLVHTLGVTVAERADAEQAADRTTRELSDARDAHEKSQTHASDVDKFLSSAREALRKARDPLVPLGAPPVNDDDVATGWQELTTWARDALAAHRVILDELTQNVRAAAENAGRLRQEAITADKDADRWRRSVTLAIADEQATLAKLTDTEESHQRLRTRLATAPTADEVAQQLARVVELEKATETADSALSKARDELREATALKTGVDKKIAAARKKLGTARDTVVSLDAPELDEESLLGAWTALLDWAVSKAVERSARLNAAKQEEAIASKKLDDIERTVIDDLTQHDVEFGGGSVRDHASAAVASALASTVSASEEMRRRIAEAGQLRTDIADARGEAQVAKLLSDHMRTNRFPRWLITGALESLVADASATLFELSGGQFELAQENGSLQVVDHNDADSWRPVKTLSGGETFQASLSLALALSSQLGALAAAGATQLDSIFLDEGFGTLDEATLDTVASTLENLAASGDRMVGVITHVATLAERVPVRFLVTRDSAGSHIVREGV